MGRVGPKRTRLQAAREEAVTRLSGVPSGRSGENENPNTASARSLLDGPIVRDASTSELSAVVRTCPGQGSGQGKRARFRKPSLCLLGGGQTSDCAVPMTLSREFTMAVRPPVGYAPVGSRVVSRGNRTRKGTVVSGGTMSRTGVRMVKWDDSRKPTRVYTNRMMYNPESLPMAGVEIPPLELTSLGEVSKPGASYASMALALGLPVTASPFGVLAAVERQSVDSTDVSARDDPKSCLEVLVRSDWREWMGAVKKEHDGWVSNGVYTVVRKRDMEPDSVCVDVREVYTVKRDGTYKLRTALRGDQMRKDKDYSLTFSATVTADSVRFFFSLATCLGKQVHSADVKQAYLQAMQRETLYASLPSYMDLVDLSWEQLAEVRRELLLVKDQYGMKAVRKMARQQRRQSPRVLKLIKSVYGSPSAGREWGLLLIETLTQRMGFKRSRVDGCVYWKVSGKQTQLVEQGGPSCYWYEEYIVLLTWTDDIPYFGTPRMCKWFKETANALLPLTWSDICRDFIGIEVNQDLLRGITQLTQSKYWLAAQERFKEHLKPPAFVRIPLSERCVLEDPTPEQVEEAAHLPCRQLLGCMAYPSCHTKLEIRYAISMLSRHMNGWSVGHWKAALHCLKYCICTRDIGIVYTRCCDPHGPDVLYGYADSSYSAPRSQGGRMVMMNGAMISFSSQRHSTVDTSTTSAELTEAFLCSNDIVAFRNLMNELGMVEEKPTVLYQDNQPAIQVASGNRNLASKTKHMDIRVWKLRERIDDRLVVLEFCATHDMLADIGTKALGVSQFQQLRDLANGYALCRAMHPDMDLRPHLEESRPTETPEAPLKRQVQTSQLSAT